MSPRRIFTIFSLLVALLASVLVLALVVLILATTLGTAAGKSPQEQKATTDETNVSDRDAVGVEGVVEQIARATYERDFEVLQRHAAPETKEHYGRPYDFEQRVSRSLRDAPEIPYGKARMVEAAPANLFGKAVFYQVVMEDRRGAEHTVGIVLKDPPDDAATELTYCYIYVENNHLGEPGDEAGLWRDLIGTQDTCLPEDGEGKDLDDGLTASLTRHIGNAAA